MQPHTLQEQRGEVADEIRLIVNSERNLFFKNNANEYNDNDNENNNNINNYNDK